MSDPDTMAPGPAPGPDEAGYAPRPERSIAALLAGLANDMRTLFRLELALFKAELAEKLRRLGRGASRAGDRRVLFAERLGPAVGGGDARPCHRRCARGWRR